MKRLRLAGVGCGSRTSTYLQLAATMSDRFEIVGAADPIAWKVERIAKLSTTPNFRRYANAAELLADERIADVMIIGTQDQYHIEPCMAALAKGYDVLLEKPIATSPEDVLKLEAFAKPLGRRVLICHVLRYTPFYQKVKDIISSGLLGEVVTIHASEGVGTFHQAHSFVRGHWSVTETSSPMIIQKSCHDLDIIQWMVEKPFHSVSSFGRQSYFNRSQMPAGAPAYCIDGCPAADSCQYNAMRYFTDQRGWLAHVYPSSESATDEQIRAWLKVSPWGRCAFQCDNTAVDHQVVNIDFEGGITASFTMSAFDAGRNIEVWGTRGVLRGGTYTRQLADCDIVIREHATGNTTQYSVEARNGGYAGHGGGDWGLVDALHREMHRPNPDDMTSSLKTSVESHLMGFSAEESRRSGMVVFAESFRRKHAPDGTAARTVPLKVHEGSGSKKPFATTAD